MKIRSLVALSIVLFSAMGLPALANWIALDGNRNPMNFLGLNIGGSQEQQVSPSDANGVPFSQTNPQYFNLLLNGATLSLGQATKATSVPVAAPTDPDIRPSPATITAVDAGSTTGSGQNGASIVTGSPTLNSFVVQAVNGASTARLQLSGSWVGTLALEQSIDGGVVYGAMACHVNGSIYSGSSITGNGIFDCEIAGATNFRVRATSFVGSGTAIVTATVTSFPGVVKVLNSVAPPGATSTDSSGTITTGGTYQSIIAASSSRKGCLIQNPTTATEVLNVKFGTMVNPITLAAGATIGCNQSGVILQDAVTAMGATTGHAFAAIAQ